VRTSHTELKGTYLTCV